MCGCKLSSSNKHLLLSKIYRLSDKTLLKRKIYGSVFASKVLEWLTRGENVCDYMVFILLQGRLSDKINAV